MSKLTIIMYHYVRNIKKSDNPNIKGLEFYKFKKQLNYLEKNYKIINPFDLFSNKKIKKKSCLLTFDDGYKDHIKFVFPELKKRKLSACFFPVAKPILEKKPLDVNLIHYIVAKVNNSKYLKKLLLNLLEKNNIKKNRINYFLKKYEINGRFDDKETIFVKRMLQHALSPQLRKKIIYDLFKKTLKITIKDFVKQVYMDLNDIKTLIKNKMFIGSHTHHHYWFEKLNKKEQQKEIDLSLKFLKKLGILNKNWIMCYPYGSYNDHTLKYLKEKNCTFGFTTNPSIADIKIKKLELPRLDTNDIPIK